MKKRILNKKGFTMMETIIAIVVVSLVSVAAVTLLMTSIHTTRTAIHKTQAQYFAEDVLTCFRASENASQFVEAVEFNGGFLEFAITGNKYVFTLADSKFQAVALVDYPVDGRPSFRIEILGDDDEVITSIPQFQKGA